MAAPTRKAVQLTITDLETGETETHFDCSQSGSSCDVGEGPTPPGHITSLIASRHTALLSDAGLKKNIDGGSILVEKGKDYLALKSAKGGEILYAYKMQYEGEPSTIANVPTEAAEYKKGKIDTETNKLECLEDGSNCKVSNTPIEEGISELTVSVNLAIIDNDFPNQDLPNKIEKGDYRLYKGHNFLMIKSENPLHETYYVQK